MYMYECGVLVTRPVRELVQTICGNHNVIVTLSFNPLHNVIVTQHKNYDDNLH